MKVVVGSPSRDSQPKEELALEMSDRVRRASTAGTGGLGTSYPSSSFSDSSGTLLAWAWDAAKLPSPEVLLSVTDGADWD